MASSVYEHISRSKYVVKSVGYIVPRLSDQRNETAVFIINNTAELYDRAIPAASY